MATDWNVMRVTGIRGGEKYVKLTASSLVIPFSQRYGATGDNIVLTTSLVGINAGEYTIAWSGDNITLLDDENFDIIKYADVSTLDGDNAKITVTVTSKNVSYSDTVTLNKVYEEDIKEHLGIKDSYPTTNDSGGALVKGDSFVLEELVEEEYVYTPYTYTGTDWVETTDNEGNVLPQHYDTLMQSATSIFESGKNVSQSSAAIWGYFKNLVATNAFVENLTAKNLEVGEGGEGFRFRAMSDRDMDGSNSPVFDVYADNVKLFEIVPNGDDYGDITLGDYENNRGMKYDHSEHEFDVRGSLHVSDGVKNTFKALSKSDGESNIGDVEIGDYAAGKGAKYFANTGEFKAKFSEIRNVLPYTYMDSLDATHPFEIDFFIPEETVNIVSIKLNARGLAYRAYSSTLGVNEGYWNARNTGSTTPSLELAFESFGKTGAAGEHSHSYDRASGTGYNEGSHTHSLTVPYFDNASTSTAEGHSHGYVVPTGVSSGGAHGHSISHSSATTSSVNNHSHSVSIANGIKGGAHKHSIDISHSHNIVFGIYEGTIPASVNLYCDNGSGYGSAISLGSGALLAENLNLTARFSGNGWKKIKFTSNRLGRITALLMVNVDITA